METIVGPMRALFVAVALAFATLGCASKEPVPPVPEAPHAKAPPHCPEGMAVVATFCVDRYEAYVVELDAQGNEHPHSPYETVEGLTVRAKDAAGVVPQGYISRVEAAAACENAGKRLCTADEFVYACSGGDPTDNDYPYGGHERRPGTCNEGKGSAMVRLFCYHPTRWTFTEFNDPRLNEWQGGLAPTGSYPKCVSPFGLYDCVGNLHEWVDEADPLGRGRFRGGFYGDAENNGPGCKYVTHAHMPTYHDYSTGFRCCADPK